VPVCPLNTQEFILRSFLEAALTNFKPRLIELVGLGSHAASLPSARSLTLDKKSCR
jgi:hypothetical protein